MKEVTYRRIVTAIFLIGIGKVLLLNNLNLLPFTIPDYVYTWQAMMVVFGAYVLLAYRSIAGIFLIIAGAYFLIPEIHDLSKYNIQAFWPAILIFIGIGIFVKSIFRSSSQKKKSDMNTSTNNAATDIDSFNTSTNYPETNNDSFKASANNDSFFNSTLIFAGEKKKLSTYEFKGANITTICGGLELDLTDCYLSKEGPNVIDFSVICGGVSLKVSKDWSIKTEITQIMSGIEDQVVDMPDSYVDPAAELRLTGVIVMGGIEIKRV
jgi:predicted membrane protein